MSQEYRCNQCSRRCTNYLPHLDARQQDAEDIPQGLYRDGLRHYDVDDPGAYRGPDFTASPLTWIHAAATDVTWEFTPADVAAPRELESLTEEQRQRKLLRRMNLDFCSWFCLAAYAGDQVHAEVELLASVEAQHHD